MAQISILQVKPGMVLDAPIFQGDSNKLLLSAGVTLTESKIAQLERMGYKSLDIADRFTRFTGPYEKMEKYMKAVYNKYIGIYASEKEEENITDDMIFAAKITKNLVEEICTQKNIMKLCIQMHIQSSDLLFEHAVMSSVFSGLVSGSLHLSIDLIRNAMIGGLLHNVGLLDMAYLIPAKGNLKGQQQLLWNEHPSYGYYMAIQEGISKDIATIILEHEERWDGFGYPKQLKGEEISLVTRIVTVCSSISELMLFHDQQPYEAMEYLYGASNLYFDKRIVDAFAANIALYPLGTLVRLTTGEVGVVSNVRKNKGPRPVVNIYFNRFNKPYETPVMVDLGKERTIFISQIIAL